MATIKGSNNNNTGVKNTSDQSNEHLTSLYKT